MPSPDSKPKTALLLLATAALLAGCATGPERDAGWRATGLPAQFDYVCESGRRGHDRISIDLPRKVWARKSEGPYPIARIEPYRLILEEGIVGTNNNQRIIDIATGAYFLEINMADPVISAPFYGECKVRRFTYQTLRAQDSQ